MFKSIRLSKLSLILSAVFIANVSFSQKESFIKINITNEFIKGKSFIKGFGLSFEKHITKHSGVEGGIWYRTYNVHGSVRSGDLFYNYTLHENHFSIPVLYKYSSSIIDFSVGPTIDFYGDWSVNKFSDLKVISDKEKKNFGVGFLAKASKSLIVSNKLYVEPEIHFNPMLLIKRNYIGVGLSLKYGL